MSNADAVRATLDAFVDPLVGKPLGEAGAVKSLQLSGGTATIELELGFPAAGYRDALAAGVAQALRDAHGVQARVTVGWSIGSHAVQKNLKPLPEIRNIIA